LTFNPATGANYPFSDIGRRAFPEYGQRIAGQNRTAQLGFRVTFST